VTRSSDALSALLLRGELYGTSKGAVIQATGVEGNPTGSTLCQKQAEEKGTYNGLLLLGDAGSDPLWGMGSFHYVPCLSVDHVYRRDDQVDQGQGVRRTT
jgi:hypothetical protein